MKVSTLFLIASIILNATLGVWIVNGFVGPTKPLLQGNVKRGLAESSGRVSPAAREFPLATKPWAGLQEGPLNDLPERLRAAGFPPHLVRAILKAEVAESFAAKRRAVLAAQPPVQYWKYLPQYFGNERTAATLNDLQQEQAAILARLFPNETDDDEATLNSIRRIAGDLSKQKVGQLENVIGDYNNLRMHIKADAGQGPLKPEDRDKLALLEKEQNTDISSILSPEQFEEFEMRQSSTAYFLRSTLQAFDPSEEEYRAIFKVTRKAEAQYGSLADEHTLTSARAQVFASIMEGTKTILTPERFNNLKRFADFGR